ncbi:MAG: sodium:solute symporter family transporter, partial [Brachybacterium sp.]
VMMPFYYGSKVRSVPEFMRMRFGTGAHLVNAISFAIAQLLIAGVNLYLLAMIVHRLLGWPQWVGLIVAAAFVLFYITVGGLTAAIYNEVLQFFVIVAALLPLTLIGLHRVGGWDGLKERVAGDGMGGAEQLHTWPGQALSGFDSPVLSVIGIVFGLGFVLSFGYWTTNFVEVQRAMASKSITAARMTPIIGAFPKMLIPFIVIVPGMIAAVLVGELTDYKQLDHGGSAEAAAATGVTYNDALLLLMRDVLPNGLLGVAIAGLLAAFMAGMAANISAFNTVVSYDLYQQYVKKDAPDDHYTMVGRVATAAACVIAIFTALIAGQFSNLMDYLQTLFGFFNAPLFATFILGMFWKRMTATAGWTGLVSGTLAAVALWASSTFFGVFELPGQGLAFVSAATAFVVDIVVSVVVTQFTAPKPAHALKGLVYSETPRADLVDLEEKDLPLWRRPVPMAGLGLILVIILNIVFA